ncbi:MAG TPA: alpha/beta hydrolase [Thermodesulfobacteriota bacterium]|nr:alpha/beta hydrolase [Thermodesulfobacteriota bacterium]
MDLVNPVIVVPGITATYLRNEYKLPPDFVWTVMTKEYEKVALHPDDLRYEMQEPARLRPDQLYEIAYKELIEELRFNLSRSEGEKVPVYPFGYDWRMKLEDIESALDEFIREVIDRTKLLKHYHNNGYGKDPRVNLIGHSMGGLIIAGYLKDKGAAAPVDKVATLATPYQGSFEAVIKVTTGTANLGTSPPSSREREAARVTPSLYYLVPSFKNGLVILPENSGLPDTLFDPALWQWSIIKSIEAWVKLKGLPDNTRTHLQRAQEIFERMLSWGREHRNKIDGFRLSDAKLTPNRWLAVVGVGAETRVKLRIEKRGRYPEFVLSSSDRANFWDKDKVLSPVCRLTGDGTVPFEGAVPKFLALENLVCVTPDDYGYWEIGDKLLNEVGGFHGILPNMNMLHRLLVRFFTGAPDKYGNTWGRRAPGVAKGAWAPPLDLADKTER